MTQYTVEITEEALKYGATVSVYCVKSTIPDNAMGQYNRIAKTQY